MKHRKANPDNSAILLVMALAVAGAYYVLVIKPAQDYQAMIPAPGAPGSKAYLWGNVPPGGY